MRAKYNIAIIGKTGTGKSSLINYLFQTSIAKAGIGLPVTQKGFHPYSLNVNGLPVCIYDSWGLEAGRADEWVQELDTELNQRGIDKPAEHWFHTVFYCINAGGHRVETYDIRIIRKFLTSRYKVTVILTKADLATVEQLDDLAQAIRREVGNLPVIPVCAEEKLLKSGKQASTFGRRELFIHITREFWDSICLRLPERCTGVLKRIIDAWRFKHLSLLETASGKLRGNAQQQVTTAMKQLESEIQRGLFERAVLKELHNTFALYNQFGNTLVEFPESKRVSVLKSLPQEQLNLLQKLPLLAGPILGPIAYITARALGDKVRQNKYIEAVNSFSDQLRQEAQQLEPEIFKLLEEAKKSVIEDPQHS